MINSGEHTEFSEVRFMKCTYHSSKTSVYFRAVAITGFLSLTRRTTGKVIVSNGQVLFQMHMRGSKSEPPDQLDYIVLI